MDPLSLTLQQHTLAGFKVGYVDRGTEIRNSFLSGGGPPPPIINENTNLKCF